MVRQSPWILRLPFLALLALLATDPARPAGSQTAPDPIAAEETRERQALERYISLLEKNPRRGTALDRAYGYHVERGTLDTFVKTYRNRLAMNPTDGTAALILGLLEFQRGQDAAAVAALKQAESARPDDPLPSYYLGQALVMVGRPEQAAEAFETAIRRKPMRNDLLEIFQALGRVYQRTNKPEQALAVWNRLEALFPNDPRVQEQIASTLADEDQPAQALPRFEALARSTRDPFRQVQYRIQAADLKVRLGKTDEALRDFEAMLAKLRPESWLHKEVRRKIEEVFLKNDDRAGLVTYYERWTKREPEDVEAMVRLARMLSSLGRTAEAQPWYEKAIRLAPGRRDLRLALISHLTQEKRFAEAAAQYEQLDRAESNNPDTLKDWGSLVLSDDSRPMLERKAAAASIWRRLLDARPNDPVATAQVADLLRHAELVDDALALYRRAIEQAPNNPQYREYLGEYFHKLKRPAEAVAEWSRMAEGPNRNPRNLGRLAEVLAGFGYLQEAVQPLTDAIALEPDDFDLRMRLAEFLHRLGRFDEAEKQLAAAAGLAARPDQRASVLESRVRNDQQAGRLSARIDAIRKELEAQPAAPAERWIELARYLEADGRLPDAVHAAGQAIAIDPRSIPAWTLAARVRESAGNLGDAVAAFRRLSEFDRRNRAEYLTGIARLESRLGRVDAAIRAGRELLAATSASPEQSEFFAGLCFQHGRVEEGLDALRRAVRANPRDSRAMLTLAETLAGQYQTDEAIELYWRAFDRADDLDNKLDVVRKLTELYLQRNQLDRLLTRLEHQDRDDRPGGGGRIAAPNARSQRREVGMYLAQAYASSGDIGGARAELERLLAANNRDTMLLQQISKLAEDEGDIEGAASFQKRLVDLASDDDSLSRLADLYARAGEIDEAQAIWSRMAAAQGSGTAYHVYSAMETLLFHQKPAAVVEMTGSLLRKNPQDWEALYHRGVAAFRLNQPETAAQAFRTLLDIRLSEDEKSAFAKARARNPRLHGPASAYPVMGRLQTLTTMEERLGLVVYIRMFCGLDAARATLASRSTWSPADFGQARMAALGWLYHLAEQQGTAPSQQVLSFHRERAAKRPLDLQALRDWLYLCAVRLDYAGSFAAARTLAREQPTDPVALWTFLHSLSGRHMPTGQRLIVSQLRAIEDTAPPLDQAELDLVLSCYKALIARRPELAQAEILQNIDDELRRAGRIEDEQRFYRDAVTEANQIGRVAAVLNMAAKRGDVDALIELGERYDRLQTGRSQPNFTTGSFSFFGPGLAMCQGMSACAARKAYGDVLRLLDLNLAASRRRLERPSARSSRARLTTATPAVRRTSQIIWDRNTYNLFTIDFPEVNEYLDAPAIQVLRQAFVLYRRDDLMSDLIDHFRNQASAATNAAAANQARLALATLLWWDRSRDEAIAELTRVVEASRPESDLRIDLAQLMEQQGDFDGALALVDAVQPMDNRGLRRREQAALRLAVRTGNIDRARQAAERLFGLRLDTETQITLAGQMHQIGLHEMAEALTGRARRRAGHKATELVRLMLQYQRQDRADLAVQVAMQILRSTRTASASTPAPLIRTADDPLAARTAAVTVLARSGRLNDLIRQANEELKKTPNSVQIHQTLADYYTAARQTDRALAEQIKLVRLRPEDGQLRIRVAGQLVDAGKLDAAADQYLAAFRRDLGLLDRVSPLPVLHVFRSTNRLGDLLDLFGDRTIPGATRPFWVALMFQEVIADDRLRDRAIGPLRRYWRANPSSQTAMLYYLHTDAVWRIPDFYEMALSAILQSSTNQTTVYDQWEPFQAYNARAGTTNPPVATCAARRIVDVAESRGRLDDLAATIAEARKSHPDWDAGDFLLAMIAARAGRHDELHTIVRKLDDPKARGASVGGSVHPIYAFTVLGDELENRPGMLDVALAVYETATFHPYSIAFARMDTARHPVNRLIALLVRQDRLDEARRIALRYARQEAPSSSTDELIHQARIVARRDMARKLIELGDPAEAVPLFSEALVLASGITPDAPNYFDDTQLFAQQVREGLESVLAGLDSHDVSPIAGRLVADALAAAQSAKGAAGPRRDQALDLICLVHPRSLDRATLRSLVAESLAASTPEQLAALDEPLNRLRQSHPDDLSVAIASALHALATGDSGRIKLAIERLDRLVERTPLEPLPAGARANARQRDFAARQVPLWLVARALEHRPDSHEHRDIQARLSAHAIEAARRQSDKLLLLAIVREQGEHALTRGDRKAAEAAWSHMLDLVIPAPPLARRRSRTGQVHAAAPTPASARTRHAPEETPSRRPMHPSQ